MEWLNLHVIIMYVQEKKYYQVNMEKSCLTNPIVFYYGMTGWVDERWILSACISARLSLIIS